MICISIQEKHRGKATSLANSVDMAEIRIDLAGYKEKDVEFIFSKADCILIATCRTNENIGSEQQISLLSAAIEAGADYVDIDINDDASVKNEILPLAKAKNCKVIVSYHNFESTPSTEELEKLIDSCNNEGADLVKIATTAQNLQDSARILSLYSTERNLVALAMGDAGRVTRFANIALGSPFTFAAVDKDSVTAPGQFTADQMKKILEATV